MPFVVWGAMPWGVFKTGSEDKPHCVYRVNAEGERFGKSRGCHPSKHAAWLQIAAIEHAMEESGGKMEGYGQININLKAPVLIESDSVADNSIADADDKAKWTRAYINNLPNGAFLHIESGGKKDDDGKTVPRSLRHLPYKGSTGSVDLPHLRNALSRLGQPVTGTGKNGWLTETLRKRLQSKAKRILKASQKEVIDEDDSLEGEMDEVRRAFNQTFPGSPHEAMAVPSYRPWIMRTFEDFLIVEVRDEHFKVSFSRDGDEFEFTPFSEWEPVERKEEWVTKEKEEPTPIDVKPGKLQDLKEKFASILEDIVSMVGLSDKAEGEKPESGFKTFTAKDGKTWLLIWTTNAFKDRDGEIFTTKSIEEYVERHADEENKGEMRFWHIPGSKFADILWQGMSGRFLVEAGPFDDTYIGNAFKDFFLEHGEKHLAIAPLGWGTSHGFEYIPEDREDKVYDWFEKKESSVLPRSAASNLYNPKMEVIRVDETQLNALKAIGGDELAQAVIETGESTTKVLEPIVAHKATDIDPDAKTEADKQPEPASDKEKEPEPKAEETEPETKSESEVEYMTKEEATAGFMALAEVIKEQRKDLMTIAEAITELVKTDEQKIAELAETTPKASVAEMIKSVIGLEETRVDGRTKLAQGPKEATPTSAESETGIPLIDNIKKLNRTYGQPQEE